MWDLTAIQRDAMTVIACWKGQVTNDEIREEIERFYGKEIENGELETNLRKLVEKGLADCQQIDGRTYGFTITKRGLNELREKKTWEESFYESIETYIKDEDKEIIRGEDEE